MGHTQTHTPLKTHGSIWYLADIILFFQMFLRLKHIFPSMRPHVNFNIIFYWELYFIYLFIFRCLELALFIIIIIIYFTIFYWFCHTSICIHHGYTHVPRPEPPSHLPSHIIPLGHPSAPTPSFLYPAFNLDWKFISYMILYMF